MTIIEYTIVDAFTSVPFQGNPAAVVIVPSDQTFSDLLLQNIAAEFNLSETAFITTSNAGQISSADEPCVHFGLRWFSPKTEIRLCGHATLASAQVLFADTKLVASGVDLIKFATLSGELVARRVAGGKVELEFPAGLAKKADDELSGSVIALVHQALGSSPLVKEVHVGVGATYGAFALVNLEESFDLEAAQVEASLFNDLKDTPIWAVILTSTRPSTVKPDTNFISRVFAPRLGVPEDPVTGSAHCLLATYWSTVLGTPAGQVIAARQVSPRGGNIDVVWKTETGTVLLRGDSVVVARGEMYH